jgi:type I restriction-modification system DNA methylase subunit
VQIVGADDQFHTPDELVRMMLDALPLTAEHWVVDLSCGEGHFLRGAVAGVGPATSAVGVVNGSS